MPASALQIESLIKAGDELRRLNGVDVLAKLAIAKIGADRRKRYGEFSDAANEAAAPLSMQIGGQPVAMSSTP